MLAALLLVSCRGDGERTPAPGPAVPVVAGTASAGLPADAATLKIAAEGLVPREAGSDASGRYQAPASGLAGPVVALGNLASADTTLAALAAAPPERLNLSLLTHLQAIELLAARPSEALAGLLQFPYRGVDLSPLTPARLERARRRMLARLQERLGLTVPETLAATDFASVAFSASSGDPLYDFMAQVQAALAREGLSIGALETERVAQLAPCRAMRLDTEQAGTPGELCPTGRQTVTLSGSGAGAQLEHRYTTAGAGTLVVRTQGTAVLAVALSLASGSHGCEGAVCAGLAVGEADEDGQRRLQFTALALPPAGGAGAAPLQLDGELGSAIPDRPPLPCDGVAGDSQPAWLRAADGSYSGLCLSFLRLGAGAQWLFDSQFSPADRYVEVRLAADATPVAVSLYGFDRLAQPGVEQRCLGSDCGSGIRLGEPRLEAGGRRVRELRLRDVPLAGLGLQAGQRSTLSGRFLVEVGPDPVLPDCTRATDRERLAGRVSDEAADWNLCPPYDPGLGNPSARRVQAGDFGLRYVGQRLYQFANTPGVDGELDVVVNAAGGISYLRWGRSAREAFACEGLGCGGVRFSAADAAGAHGLDLAGVLLDERRLDGSRGERSVRLDGALKSAPDCQLDGNCP